MTSFVGIDVSSQTLDAFISSTHASGRFPNTLDGVLAMLEWLSRQAEKEGQQLVIEPTNTYHHLLVQILNKKAISYTLINPASTKAYARWQGKRAKTDRVDSKLLAQMGKEKGLDPTEPGNEAKGELKVLRRHLDWLKGQMQAAASRQESLKRSPWTPRAVLDSLERTIKKLKEEAEQVQEAIAEHLEKHSELQREVKLLTSIPGIGVTTALVLVSEMPEVKRCKNAKSWVAFCGVCPEIIESGKSRFSRLSRMGAARIRKALYLVAVTAARWNPAVRLLNERLIGKGKAGKVRVMAAMNKLLRLCFGVLRSARPFDLTLHIPLKPLEN